MAPKTYKVTKDRLVSYAVLTPDGHVLTDTIAVFPMYAEDRLRWGRYWSQPFFLRWFGLNSPKPWSYWEHLGYRVEEIEIRTFEIKQRGTKKSQQSEGEDEENENLS